MCFFGKGNCRGKAGEADEQTLSDRGFLPGCSGTPERKDPGRLGTASTDTVRSTDYGDDMTAEKNDGSWTYFAADATTLTSISVDSTR